MQECLSTCGLLLEGTRILRWGGRRRSEVFADRFVLNHWRRVRRAAMMEPSTSELLFISVNHSITLMGKLWLIVMVFLRILVLLFAGYPLYQDEQERFVCNTIQPGCANVCYDLFSPVSLFRFWLVQLVALCVPYLVFVAYVVHKVLNSVSVTASGNQIHKEAPKKVCVNEAATQSFAGAYVLHLLLRTLLEAAFGAAHYYLFGFHIPRRFLCHHAPCTTQVDCYISRPTEKTVMLNFMLGVASLCLLLNFLDFVFAVKRSVKQKSRRKMVLEEINNLGKVFKSRHIGKGPSGGRATHRDHCTHPDHEIDSVFQEDALERNGSEVALCPKEPSGTPRSIRVSQTRQTSTSSETRPGGLWSHRGSGSGGLCCCQYQNPEPVQAGGAGQHRRAAEPRGGTGEEVGVGVTLFLQNESTPLVFPSAHISI
ncbi:Gap junction delta-4 protein [Oryzias melastigma]|uniref:Gap junction protein n=1 Tax=Oryzias melastigma TaxID=30732 RepID=A0A834FE73_ORYME|nr:Gap junction delta-4 protein [Oryzias melastigma]